MDLETFFTIVYVLVDDWYKAYIAPYKGRCGGGVRRLSDSEVLTIALVGQWRVGVPWQSERGLVRYMNQHGRNLFPQMIERSAFNERVRYLWAVLVRLQQIMAEMLTSPDDLYECVGCQPLPAYSSGQAHKEQGHWLWESTVGRGGNRGSFFYGDHFFASVTASGVITGWLTATAYIQDRWLLEAFLSTRSGCPQLDGPQPGSHQSSAEQISPPIGHIGPYQAAGQATGRPYLADKGFNGPRWTAHWLNLYQAVVITAPQQNLAGAWSLDSEHWLAAHRQPIETAFAHLNQVFGLIRLNAHSRWGQYARLAAKTAAYNLGLLLNRMLNRPLLALETLIC